MKDAIRFGFRVDQFSNAGLTPEAFLAFERCVEAYVSRGDPTVSMVTSPDEEAEEEKEEELLERTEGSAGRGRAMRDYAAEQIQKTWRGLEFSSADTVPGSV